MIHQPFSFPLKPESALKGPYSSVLVWICLSTPKIQSPDKGCCNPVPEALSWLGYLCNIIFFGALLESNQWQVSYPLRKIWKSQMEYDPKRMTCLPFCLSYWLQNTFCFLAGPMSEKGL